MSYYRWTYTWEHGRQLKSLSNASTSLSFKYNSDGIRTEKTVNGVHTKYTVFGDKVSFETTGSDKIHYSYDASGNLFSMNLNGTEYYYVRNAQGDITGLIDNAGNLVVSYTYDTWGKLVSTTGSLASTLGVKNPYRYRGYRYDTETGLYYLQSRYYNPEWGRFVNADGMLGITGEILSPNMFGYCLNNPVNNFDPEGQMAESFAGMYYFGVTNAWNPLGVAVLGVAIIIGLAVFVPWDKLGQDSKAGWAWMTKQARTVATKVANSFARSTQRKYRSSKETHHLVAQKGPNAESARKILFSVGIGINSAANLIAINTSLHRRLHTDAYYGFANSLVINAANRSKSLAAIKTNVYAALAQIRAFVMVLDAAVPW